MKTRLLFTLALIAMLAESVFAAPVPAEGAKFFTIYDVMVNDIVQGPPGIAIAVGGVAYGGMQLFRNAILPAVGAAIGSVLMLLSPTIAAGLGAVIL
jgi:hypothetical protein